MGIAIFIDGPLAQEVKEVLGLPDEWRVPLPKRTTVCWCDPDEERIDEQPPAEAFTYYRVMKGDGIGLYSKSPKAKDVLQALKAWVVTDLSNTDHLTIPAGIGGLIRD